MRVCWHTFTCFKVLAFLGVTWVSLGAIVNVHTTALSCLFVCVCLFVFGRWEETKIRGGGQIPPLLVFMGGTL